MFGLLENGALVERFFGPSGSVKRNLLELAVLERFLVCAMVPVVEGAINTMLQRTRRDLRGVEL